MRRPIKALQQRRAWSQQLILVNSFFWKALSKTQMRVKQQHLVEYSILDCIRSRTITWSLKYFNRMPWNQGCLKRSSQSCRLMHGFPLIRFTIEKLLNQAQLKCFPMQLRKEERKLGKKFLVGYCSLFGFFTFFDLLDFVTLAGSESLLSDWNESSHQGFKTSSDLFRDLVVTLKNLRFIFLTPFRGIGNAFLVTVSLWILASVLANQHGLGYRGLMQTGSPKGSSLYLVSFDDFMFMQESSCEVQCYGEKWMFWRAGLGIIQANSSSISFGSDIQLGSMLIFPFLDKLMIQRNTQTYKFKAYTSLIFLQALFFTKQSHLLIHLQSFRTFILVDCRYIQTRYFLFSCNSFFFDKFFFTLSNTPQKI